MSKDRILAEIRRTATENGGVPLGKTNFLAATGIRESDWMGRYWTSWGAAVREAGFKPQVMNPRLGDEAVLQAAASIVRAYGRFPTAAEIRMACQADGTLPSHNTFRRFGGLPALRDNLKHFVVERGISDVADAIAVPAVTAASQSPLEHDRGEPDLADGFVYLIKSGRHFKIGKANSVDQRFRQLKIQLPQAAEVVHSIKTDDAYGIERYWHQRFADKRLNGEWFALSAADVKAFRRRKFM